MLHLDARSCTHFDFRSLDKYIEHLSRFSGHLEHKIYSSANFYTKAKLLINDGIIYFQRYSNFSIRLDSYVKKDLLCIDLPFDGQEVIVNGFKYDKNRQFYDKKGCNNSFIYPPGEKLTLCISKVALEKHLSTDEVELIYTSVHWFKRNEVSSLYKSYFTNLVRDRALVLENLIKLNYTQDVLYEELNRSVLHALLDYISFHRDYNKPIRIKNSERVLKRAFDYIDACDIGQLNITQLSKNIHISVRTLQYVFKKELNMTPKQFLTIEKLNLIRKDLENMDPSEPVELEVFDQYGITNFNRFRQDYYRFFNECPRDTLFKP